MSNQALIRRDDAALSVSFTESAIALKNHALEISALIGKVVDGPTQEAAVNAQKELSNVLSLVEKARQEAKAPIIAYGRAIDDSCKAFVADAKEEQLRIGLIVGDFQKLQEANARAIEQLRLAEERKLQEERRQAELAVIRAQEVERQKLIAQENELVRLAAEATSKREKAILVEQQAEIDRQRALSEAKSHEELDRIQQQYSDAMAANADRPKYEPIRATGQRVQDDWDIVVNDIWTLARAHPACVKIEPLIGGIKSLLKVGVKVAGVTATPIVKATVSRARQPTAIEV